MMRGGDTFSVRLIVFSGLVAVLGSLGFARFGYSMILPGMKDGLMLTYGQMGLIASGNFCGYMIFAILGGMLASRYGPRIVITTSLALVGVSMLLTGFIESFPQALLLRSLTGVGSGGANAPAMILPAVWLSARRRGFASGVIASGSGIGLVATGFIVPKLNDMFGSEGWRYSWLVLGAITLVLTVFCGVIIRDSPVEAASTRGDVGNLGWRQVSRDWLLWKIGFTYVMFGFSYVIYVTFFGAYLIKEVGFTAQSTGMLWAVVGVLSLASGPLWGHVSDRIGRGYGLALVYFIQSVSFFLFANRGGDEALCASAILFGLTAWSIPSIVAAYSGDHFGPKLAFSAFGFLILFFGIGQALGPFIAGYTADLTRTFTLAFLLCSFAACLGGLLSLIMLRKRARKHFESDRPTLEC